jgi:hypothetical protein
MRWRSWLIAPLLLTLACTGCARRAPHGIAERYIEALRAADYRSCYSLLTEQDRAARSFPEFLTEIPLAPDVSPVWFRPILQQTQYSLGDTTRDDATAIVPVKIVTPDLPGWERILDQHAGAAGVSAEAVQQSLDRGAYPKRIYDDRIVLVKQHHHWRIVAGFTLRDPIIDRHRQALSDFLAEHYDAAIPEWRAMITGLRGHVTTGSWGLADKYQRELQLFEERRAAAPSARAYATNLKLSNVAMKMSEERTPAILGTVRNTGTRAVDGLVLTVTWYRGRGKDLQAVSREEHPVVATPIQFTDFSRPVEPLAPGAERPFGFVLTAPTGVQQEASPYVTVGALALEPVKPAPPRNQPKEVANPPSLRPAATFSPVSH